MLSQLNTNFPHFRLTLTITAILTLMGAVSFLGIHKEEDPDLLNRNGFIKIVFPGADPIKIEDWVVSPLEAKLLAVDSILNIETKIRPNVAIMNIELKPSITNTDNAWNDIERELDSQKTEFPNAVSDVELERDVMELEAVLISVENSDVVKLSDEAIKLKRYLEKLNGIKSIKFHGDPEIGINVQVETKDLAKAGIRIDQLVSQIQRQNQSLPSGSFSTKEGLVQLKTKSSLDSDSDVKNIPILFQDLKSKNIDSIANISRGPAPTPNSIVRNQGQNSIVVGLIPETPMDVLKWGHQLKEKLSIYKPIYKDTQIKTITFQPDRTKFRIKELTGSLMVGMMSVILILGFWMGWRIGAVVAISVPLISIIGFGFYFLGGGILHQISMAALLLSLGQFIDNVTVVAEATQRRIDEGLEPAIAAKLSSNQFKLPMIFATGTGIAAFLPLLASEGPTAEFTSSIPLIAVITLLVSYFFAIQTTPILCALFLKPQKYKSSKALTLIEKLLAQKNTIVILCGILVIVSVLSFVYIPKQFFPGADRNEFSLTLQLPETSSIFQTNEWSKKIEKYLINHPKIKNVTTFVGQSTPHFYYSLITESNIPKRADFLILSDSPNSNSSIIQDLTKDVIINLPEEIQLIPKILSQGPPTESAIELEVFSDKYDELVKTVHLFVNNKKDFKDLRTSAPKPLKVINVNLNENFALENNYDRNQLSTQLISYAQGLTVSHYYQNGQRYPIRITQNRNQNTDDGNYLKTFDQIASTNEYKDLNISELSSFAEDQVPSIIERKNGKRYVRIFSELNENQGYNEVAPRLIEQVKTFFSSLNVEILQGGQAGESSTANLAILRALPLGMILLIGCLLFEFRSFRKLLLVSISLGLVSLGSFLGLFIGQQAFGFTSLLGLLALIGIVVNNCILIIEAIEEERVQGHGLEQSISTALSLRARPIILTTIMTFFGLLPLAFERSTLWPPMAWTMISGLIVSTFVCLLVLPLMYQKMFATLVLGFLLIQGFTPNHVMAMSLSELLSSVETTNKVQAQKKIVEMNSSVYKANYRSGFLPKVSASFDYNINDRDLFIGSPLGQTQYGQRHYTQGGVELRQPLFSMAEMKSQVHEKNMVLQSSKTNLILKTEMIKLEIFKLALAISENYELTKLLISLNMNLENQKKETQRLLFQGKASNSDLAKIDVEIIQTQRDLSALEVDAFRLKQNLKTYVKNFDDVQIIEIKQLQQLLSLKDSPQVEEKYWSVKSMEQESMAIKAMSQGLKYSYLPKLNLLGRYQNTQQGFLINNKDWFSFGLELKWNIYDGGSQWIQSQAQAQRQKAIELETVHAQEQIQNELKTLDFQESRLLIDDKAYADTLKRVNMVLERERKLYRFGKVNLNQVLDTERLQLQQKQNLIKTNYHLAKVRLDRWHLKGQEINGQDFESLK